MAGAGRRQVRRGADHAVRRDRATRCDFACEVKDLEPTEYVDHKESRRMDRFTQLALAAARQAEADSGLDIAAEPDRVGAAVATGIGGLKSFEACIDQLDDRGPDRVNPFSIVQIIPNLAARLGVDGARHEGPARSPSAPRAPPRTWRSATGSTRSGWAART